MVEGPRAVEAALDRGVALEHGLSRARAPARRSRICSPGSSRPAIPVATLKEGVLERVGTTVTPQPVLAVASIPDARPRRARPATAWSWWASRSPTPATSARSCGAPKPSGAAAIVLGPGSVDAYNPKVVRASAGAIFGVAVVEAGAKGWSAVEALEALGELGRQRLGADAGGGRRIPRSTSAARPRSCSATKRTGSAPSSTRTSTAASRSRWPGRPSRSTWRWRRPSCASSRRGSAA